METVGPEMGGADLELLKNSIIIDKYLKRFMHQTTSLMHTISYNKQNNTKYDINYLSKFIELK